ncbi:MAG: hypothetical protein LBC02_02585 [Planctomycetaceae bacterium]|jgi:hypothetical protein|nr:hypothetical protein [Planctomycetaceae bacterium]
MSKKTISYLYLLFSIFFFILQSDVVCGEFPLVERERLEVVADNTPLARSEDKPAWDYLFGILREHSETEIDKAEHNTVGFTELSRQPVEYRGKLVRITGQLVRCEWIPQHQKPEPFDEEQPKESHGFYDSWILVRDKKDIPVSVCSLAIPEQFPVGDGLSEEVSVTGFFYKRRLFLSSDNEELTTPTILAKTFHWERSSSIEKPKPVSVLKLIRNNTVMIFVFLLFLWFIFRIFSRFFKRSKRKPIQIKFSNLPPTNGNL